MRHSSQGINGTRITFFTQKWESLNIYSPPILMESQENLLQYQRCLILLNNWRCWLLVLKCLKKTTTKKNKASLHEFPNWIENPKSWNVEMFCSQRYFPKFPSAGRCVDNDWIVIYCWSVLLRLLWLIKADWHLGWIFLHSSSAKVRSTKGSQTGMFIVTIV